MRFAGRRAAMQPELLTPAPENNRQRPPKLNFFLSHLQAGPVEAAPANVQAKSALARRQPILRNERGSANSVGLAIAGIICGVQLLAITASLGGLAGNGGTISSVNDFLNPGGLIGALAGLGIIGLVWRQMALVPRAALERREREAREKELHYAPDGGLKTDADFYGSAAFQDLPAELKITGIREREQLLKKEGKTPLATREN
ncbi:Uncharacterised protein [uncultured archaeon]|nr:Uncharacterised protein [uncultured archaeon]